MAMHFLRKCCGKIGVFNYRIIDSMKRLQYIEPFKNGRVRHSEKQNYNTKLTQISSVIQKKPIEKWVLKETYWKQNYSSSSDPEVVNETAGKTHFETCPVFFKRNPQCLGKDDVDFDIARFSFQECVAAVKSPKCSPFQQEYSFFFLIK